MNNETSSIHFSTIERLCTIFECTPGDIIVLKKGKKRGGNNK
ncbi:MAG: helix-turn-helix transcriptional regulator [Clostridia bacterium]|nr:helix-turn-helix transcriptional regulator [Clostridia bacterium]